MTKTEKIQYIESCKSGDRTKLIKTSFKAGTFTMGDTSKLIDGNNGNTVYFTSNSNIGFTLEFEFPLCMTAYTLSQSSNVAHGTWKILGSNDNSNYVEICKSILNTGTVKFENKTNYKYYKFENSEGNPSTAPWLYEFDFDFDIKKSSDADGWEDDSCEVMSNVFKDKSIDLPFKLTASSVDLNLNIDFVNTSKDIYEINLSEFTHIEEILNVNISTN